MTAQIYEKLILGGKETSMAFCPPLPENDSRLTRLRNDQLKDEGMIFSTACWREYVGTWEIKDDQFYLVNINGRFILTSDM